MGRRKKDQLPMPSGGANTAALVEDGDWEHLVKLTTRSILGRVTNSFAYGGATNRGDLFAGITVGAVEAMLAFVYTGNYRDGDEGNDREYHLDTGPVWLNVQVHVAARRLSIPALALLSTLKFTQRARPLLLTDKFAAAVKEIYSVSPHLNLSLQDSVIAMCKDDAAEILTGNSKSFNHIRHVAQQVPLFAAQLEHHTPSDTRKRKAVSEANTPTNGPFCDVYEDVRAGQLLFTCRNCNKAIQAAAQEGAMRFCPYCGSAKNRYMR